jgi:uracil-DNA glycosylase family 4
VARSKQSLYAELVARVQRCQLCPRMANRSRVLGPFNGNLDAPVVFIAEAPGRLGADKFGIPLHADQSGRNFNELISSVGLDRDSVFVTNAVLCNPRTTDGNNDSPTLTEIRNCSGYLRKTIEIVRPRCIAPLGAAALAALDLIEHHGIRLSEGVARTAQWRGYVLYPLYHPGPRAVIWRTRAQQLADYRSLTRLLAQCRGASPVTGGKTR